MTFTDQERAKGRLLRKKLCEELMTFNEPDTSGIIHLDCNTMQFKILARGCSNLDVVRDAGRTPYLDMTILTEKDLRHFPGQVLFGYQDIKPFMIKAMEEGNPSLLVESTFQGCFGIHGDTYALLPSAILAVEKPSPKDYAIAKEFNLPIAIIHPAPDTARNEKPKKAETVSLFKTLRVAAAAVI